ncbi:hypothetical protein GGH95_002357 [Coemansia sp. RSA 1836]|nr:hypothetical protein GGH95_002357 [Coemansia sp. RSA 1836]
MVMIPGAITKATSIVRTAEPTMSINDIDTMFRQERTPSVAKNLLALNVRWLIK